jgi:membrane protein YdbS with pleckstrin-like domain
MKKPNTYFYVLMYTAIALCLALVAVVVMAFVQPEWTGWAFGLTWMVAFVVLGIFHSGRGESDK